MDKSPQQSRLEKQVKEYASLVKDNLDNIGLTGNQPTLRKIRSAWHKQEINEQDLNTILVDLAKKLDGEGEVYKDHKEVYKYMFGKNLKKQKLNPVTLSAAEQAAAIVRIMPSKKKSLSPRKKKVKKEETINKSAIPAHLQHLL